MVKCHTFVQTNLTVTYRKFQFRSHEICKQNMFLIEKYFKYNIHMLKKTAAFSKTSKCFKIDSLGNLENICNVKMEFLCEI